MHHSGISSCVTGWGIALPERIMTNDELAQFVDTTDEWIRSRTGIAERRIASPQESASTLATQAARRALEVANIRADQIDLILVATTTSDYAGFPSTAALVQHALGASHAAACDVSAACAGFVYSLSVAHGLLIAGACKTILVIGSEVMSRILDWTDRSTCVLFGDGAGALVLQAEHSSEPCGVLSVALGSDGAGSAYVTLEHGCNTYPPLMQAIPERQQCLRMNGREVFKFAVQVMNKSIRDVLERAGMAIGDITLFVPHQANKRIIDAAAKSLNVPADCFFQNIERYGNTSGASIPIALYEAIAAGRIQRGDTILLTGFGAGLSWGSCILRW